MPHYFPLRDLATSTSESFSLAIRLISMGNVKFREVVSNNKSLLFLSATLITTYMHNTGFTKVHSFYTNVKFTLNIVRGIVQSGYVIKQTL